MGEKYGGHGMQYVKLTKPKTNLWPKTPKPGAPATLQQVNHLQALLPAIDVPALNMTVQMADDLFRKVMIYKHRITHHKRKARNDVVRMIHTFQSTADNRGSHSVSHGAGREKTTES